MRNKKLLLGVLAVIIFVGANYITFHLTREYFNGTGDAIDVEEQVRGGEETISPDIDMEEYYRMMQVIEVLQNNYLEEVEISSLLEGAIRGMLESLDDPHTSYLDGDDMEEFSEQMRGTFGGVGVIITEVEDRVTVLEVFPDTPAEKEGLKEGDRIWKVDGEELSLNTVEEASERMRGEPGSEVEVTVNRPGAEEPVDISLTREEIQVHTVEGEWLQDGVARIEISRFDGLTGAEFGNVLSKKEEEGLDGLVLDLRGNPGGSLEQTVEVAQELVPEGEIVRKVGRDGEILNTYYSRGEGKPYPVTVLVNRETASGAEILAGALQDHGAAALVGETTYGKATVQVVQELYGQGGLSLTIARYETPEGRNIDEDGLEPDYYVEMPEVFRYYEYFLPGRLEEGDSGESVYLLEEMLETLGYDITPSGGFDAETAETLKNFQVDSGQEATGVFDDVTWLSLREELERLVKEEDPQLQKALELLEEGN